LLIGILAKMERNKLTWNEMHELNERKGNEMTE
jgi:hypothetical protein